MRLFFFTVLSFPLMSFASMEVGAIRKDPKKIIESVKTENSKDFYKLALAYFFDQEVDKAFRYFLIALEKEQKKPTPYYSSDEKEIFEEAFKLYLQEGAVDPIKTAEKLRQKYGEIVNLHPEYHQLNFLLSTSYGNLGMYDLFFENFYKNYGFFKDSFLSYKTQAVLYLRLSQHGVTTEERDSDKKMAKHFFEKSLECNPDDMSLYKALIYLAKEEKNKECIREYLKKITLTKEVIPRGDLMNHVKEAISLEEYQIAQQFIDKAKNEYEYSRAIVAAQEFLNANTIKK